MPGFDGLHGYQVSHLPHFWALILGWEGPWLVPVVLAFGRLTNEGHCKFEGSLGYRIRCCLKKKVTSECKRVCGMGDLATILEVRPAFVVVVVASFLKLNFILLTYFLNLTHPILSGKLCIVEVELEFLILFCSSPQCWVTHIYLTQY